MCIATVVVVSLIMGYNKGMAVGLFSGSQAFSAVIGVGSSTIKSLGLSHGREQAYLDIIPACYGIYARVLYALQLDDDLLLIAKEDTLGHTLQDL